MKKHYRHEHNCLNCGTDLQGKFCHHCGQENLEIKESFGHMLNHAISDYFHFDHQFFHTVKPLFFAPGKLTKEYMAGKRTQYLHPVKMYIFISLVFFLLLFRHGNEENKVEQKRITNAQLADTLTSAINKNAALDDSLKAKINYGIREGIKANSEKNSKKKKRSDDDENDYAPDGTYRGRGGIFHVTKDSSYSAYLKRQQTLPDTSRDGWLVRSAIKKSFDYTKYGSRANDIFKEELIHNVPKLMFILLPLFALILKIAFFKNHKFYVEHLIYSIHLHCFIFVFFIIIMLLTIAIPHDWKSVHNWINFLSTAAIIYYIYKSLRTVYHRSGRRTISKMFGIGFAYTIAFAFSAALLIVITAYTL